MIKAILFDLDGTLLPMDQDVFIAEYLGGMAKKLAPYGYDPQLLAKAVWKGTGAMVVNNGEVTNETVFWNAFCSVLGDGIREQMAVIEDFYRNEFQHVKNVCGFSPEASQCIRTIGKMGLRTILATNPLFPALATHSRIRWAGLEPEDFELITTYENSRHCKPNPAYYQDILDTIGLSARECIMIGNDATEDMAAQSLGIPVFILTNCLINKENRDLSSVPHGDFADMMNYVREMTV